MSKKKEFFWNKYFLQECGGCRGKLGWPRCRPRWDTHLNFRSLLNWNNRSAAITAVLSVKKYCIFFCIYLHIYSPITRKRSVRLGVASHLSTIGPPHQDEGIPLSAFRNGTTSKLAGLFFTLSLQC